MAYGSQFSKQSTKQSITAFNCRQQFINCEIIWHDFDFPILILFNPPTPPASPRLASPRLAFRVVTDHKPQKPHFLCRSTCFCNQYSIIFTRWLLCKSQHMRAELPRDTSRRLQALSERVSSRWSSRHVLPVGLWRRALVVRFSTALNNPFTVFSARISVWQPKFEH